MPWTKKVDHGCILPEWAEWEIADCSVGSEWACPSEGCGRVYRLTHVETELMRLNWTIIKGGVDG